MASNTLPVLSELNDTILAEAAHAAGEPAWLIERRLAAWQFFAEAAPPFWRRTDLTKFKPELLAASATAQGTEVQWDAALASQGVIVMPLAQALREHEALVKQYLDTVVNPLNHKFSALHSALWQDGMFVYVPKNVVVEAPVVARFHVADGSNAVFVHNLVVLERGAQATVVEEYVSANYDSQTFASPTTEIVANEASSLRYVTVQAWGSNVYHIGAQRARITDDANVEWINANLGGTLQHVEAEASLEGRGSRVEWKAATFADGKQSLLTAPTLRHVGTNTESHLDFKTVVNDGGYSTFDGMIKIEHDSKGTSTRLEEHALHLGPNARSDSIPGLMIDTNDVQRAGHASTSGQVDEEQLFYMLSRGIKRDEAVRMIVMGFFEPILDRIPSDTLREQLTDRIESKI